MNKIQTFESAGHYDLVDGLKISGGYRLLLLVSSSYKAPALSLLQVIYTELKNVFCKMINVSKLLSNLWKFKFFLKLTKWIVSNY